MFAEQVFSPRIVVKPSQNNKHYGDSRNYGRSPRVMSSVNSYVKLGEPYMCVTSVIKIFCVLT